MRSMNKKEINLHKNILCQGWFIWVAFIVAIQPDLIISKTLGAQLTNAASLFIFLIICLTTLYKRRIKVNHVLLFVFLTLFCLVVSSLINGANVVYAIRKLIVVMSICVITNTNLKDNTEHFINTVYWILYSIVLVNFITMLLYPNGIYYSYYDYYGTQVAYLRHWFIGAGNNLILVILPSFFVNQIRLHRIKKHIDIQTILLWGMGIYGVVYTGAATSMIAVVAFIIFAALVEWKNIPMPSLKIYVILGVTIFALIVFFDIANVFSGVLSFLFGADVTFTGRTRTWATAIEWIKKRPLVGYGYEYASTMISKFNDNTASHCHNLYLDLVYRSGIISLCFFLTTLLKCARPLKQFKENRISVLLSFTIFLYLGILFQMEAYFNMCMFYVILIFAANIRNLIALIEGN